MRLLLIALLASLAFTASAQYDAPGLDPVRQMRQPNPWAALKNNAGPYPAFPYRQEFYMSYQKDSVGAAVMTFSNNNNCSQVTGTLVSPSSQLMNLPKWWRRGYRGQGQNIGIFDVSYTEAALVHKSLIGKVAVYPGDDAGTTSGHSRSVVSAAVSAIQANGVVGAAPDAHVYFAVYNGGSAEDVNRLRWMIANGCNPINISYSTYPTGLFRQVMDSFIDAGGAFTSAAGNDHPEPAPVNAFCSIPGVYCVCGLAGGSVLAIQDSLYYSNTLPWYNVVPADNSRHKRDSIGIDFALPFFTMAAGIDPDVPGGTSGGAPGDGLNFFGVTSGSSFEAPQIAGALAILKQRFYKMPMDLLAFMMKDNGRRFKTADTRRQVVTIVGGVAHVSYVTDKGITVTTPSLP